MPVRDAAAKVGRALFPKSERPFPWGGLALIVASFLLLGPLSRHAHHFGLEVDHSSWASVMGNHGGGTPEVLMLNAARKGEYKTVLGSLRRGADPNTAEATVRRMKGCARRAALRCAASDQR